VSSQFLQFNDASFHTGAGNKLVAVSEGKADLYVLSDSSGAVWPWDLCGGHSLLAVQGGSIINYSTALKALKSYKGKVHYQL